MTVCACSVGSSTDEKLHDKVALSSMGPIFVIDMECSATDDCSGDAH